MAGQAAAVPDNNHLKEALAKAKEVKREKNDVYEMAVLELAGFEIENCTTLEDFLNAGKVAVHPMIDEYKRLFVHPSGDYHQAVRAFTALRVLNPIVAATMTME